MSDKTETKLPKPPKLSAAQVGCLLTYLAGGSLRDTRGSTRWALMDKGLLPRRRTDVEAPFLRAAIEAMRPHLTAEELAGAEARYGAVAAREADEEREATKLRGWLTRHGGFDADVLEDRGLHKLQALQAECLRLAGRWNKAADQIHAAAVACCAADRIEAPPPPDQMIAGIQARHLGALRWAGIIFGPQNGFERDWKHLYEIEVLDLRDDYVAMQERALAAERRANEAEAKLAALSPVCPHCGPESAGPASDAPQSCATCYGTLILTDAAGAAELRRRYDEAVSAAADAVEARAERTAELAKLSGEVVPIKTYEPAAERLSRVTPGQQIRHFRVKGPEPKAVVYDVRRGAGGEVLSFSIVAPYGATSCRDVRVWAAEGWDVMRGVAP